MASLAMRRAAVETHLVDQCMDPDKQGIYLSTYLHTFTGDVLTSRSTADSLT